MSRIGKQPIAIPPKVKVEVKGQRVSVEGPKGKLNWELPRRTSLRVDNGKVVVSRQGDDAQAKALHGLSRALVNNMVKGVSEGFVKKLEIQGVGFKAAVQGKSVSLSLGYSHPASSITNWPVSRRSTLSILPMRTEKKQQLASRRHWRVRKTISGTKERPRMSVCFTNKNIHVQFIDDTTGRTLAAASTTSP